MPESKRPFQDIAQGRTYDCVRNNLIRLGMIPETATRYALFCQWIYNEIQTNHDLSDAFRSIANANALQPMATQLGLTKSIRTLKDTRLSGKAGIVSAFVDIAKGVADQLGIPLNECALSVAKVALDLASAGVGAVTIETGVGAVWLALSIVNTFNDSYDLSKACLISSESSQ